MASPFSPFQFGDSFSPFLRRSTGVIDPEFQTGTNAEKLGGNWEVGTVFHVRDGFVVAETDFGLAGLYFDAGTTFNSKKIYRNVPSSGFFVYIGSAWSLTDEADDNGSNLYVAADGNETNPWDADWSATTIILTHPAVQTLVAPSSDQGGVAIIGGTKDGVYKDNGQIHDGRPVFQLLGDSGSGDPDNGDSVLVAWYDNDTRWHVRNVDVDLYYSLSDVATPDLATNWLNSSDNRAASITVTNVTLGELYAGLAVTNDPYSNGSSYVSASFHGRQYYMGLNGGGSNNMHWDTDFNVWTDDVGAWTTSNVAFPWEGSDNGGGHTGATFAQNDVANERNWENT